MCHCSYVIMLQDNCKRCNTMTWAQENSIEMDSLKKLLPTLIILYQMSRSSLTLPFYAENVYTKDTSAQVRRSSTWPKPWQPPAAAAKSRPAPCDRCICHTPLLTVHEKWRLSWRAAKVTLCRTDSGSCILLKQFLEEPENGAEKNRNFLRKISARS